jgi:hypothetical protein
MNKSESIKQIAVALCNVQAKLRGAKADAENPYFKSKYADLASVVDAAKALLAENGLSVVQTAEMVGNVPCLNTCLLHTSGEWISGSLPLYPKTLDPQAMGSALTYARRYSYAAMIGVVQADDDGEKAMVRSDQPAVAFPVSVLNELPPVSAYEPEFTAASPGDPGEFIVPYGEGLKGKKLKDFNMLQLTVMLKKQQDWKASLERKGERKPSSLPIYISALQAYINQESNPSTQEDVPF